MISYIKGSLEEVGDNYIVLECGSIGYYITISGQFMSILPSLHSDMKVYTYMHIREDELSLFGFYSVDEMDIFKILIGVNGVGPKVAMSLLSTLSVNELKMAVITGDAKTISKANGIGAKGASRIILELKDKLKIDDVIDEWKDSPVHCKENAKDSVYAEVVAAFTALGYTAADARGAIGKVENAGAMSEEELLKAALKQMI